MRKAVVLLGLLLGCRRQTEVRADPARVDATVFDAPSPTLTKIVRHGELIDLDSGAARELSRARGEASDATAAYVLDDARTVHAFRLSDGGEAWRRLLPGSPRAEVVAASGHVAIANGTDLTVLDKRTGDPRTIALGFTVGHVAGLGASFAVSDNKTVVIVDPVTGAKTSTVALPFDLAGWRAGVQPLADGATACAINVDAAGLQVLCFASNGAARARVTVDLRILGGPPSSFHIVSRDERYVLYAEIHFGSTRRAAAVRLADGAVFKVEDKVAAVVQREDGTIEGLLVVDPELRLLETNGTVRWRAPSSKFSRDVAFALARGGRLFASIYSDISSGSQLVAHDLKTGALLWTGDVERLPIGHSEYFNDVRLSFVRDRLLLRGDEAALYTTQLFELDTGKRAFAFSRLHR